MSIKKLTDLICERNLSGLLAFIEQNEDNPSNLNDWIEGAEEVLELYDPDALGWFYEEVFDTLIKKIDKGIKFNYLQLLLANRPIEKGFNRIGDTGDILIDADDYELLRQLLPVDMMADSYRPANSEEHQQTLIDQVERKLGLPFFRNLATIVKTRLALLDEECVGFYLEEIINGVGSRTHVDVWQILEKEIPARYKEYGAGGRETGAYLLDMLAAMGESGAGCAFLSHGVVSITDRGVELLTRVYNPFWRGLIDAKGIYRMEEV